MKDKKNIKLDLLPYEKDRLRKQKIKYCDIFKYKTEELSLLLQISVIRAMELRALSEFQSVPSVGVEFAKDLISVGYYSLEELKDKDGAKLIEELEISKGVWIDSCVEDQCRLIVHFANYRDSFKRWWDFTEERKKYRREFGYPSNRPKKAWFELLAKKTKSKFL